MRCKLGYRGVGASPQSRIGLFDQYGSQQTLVSYRCSLGFTVCRLHCSFLEVFPYNAFRRVCPCTSRKPKSDKLLKSLGVVWKTSPRESLNASGFFDWWFRMTWKLLTGTSLIECLIWLPGTQGDTQCDIWMRDFLLVINFMQSRLQTFSSSSLIHSILHFFLLQDFLAFPAVAFFTVFCEHWGVSQIPPNQKLALRIVRYDISTYMEAVCEKVGCCDKSIRSHIGLENWQFCVVSLVTLQIGTFEHLATQNTMLQNPYFFCLFSSKRLYISQLCQQYIVIAYLCNNWVFLQHIFAKPHE